MGKHIHAEKIAQFAEDAKVSETPHSNWEFFSIIDNKWIGCQCNPSWSKNIKYRRKSNIKQIKDAFLDVNSFGLNANDNSLIKIINLGLQSAREHLNTHEDFLVSTGKKETPDYYDHTEIITIP